MFSHGIIAGFDSALRAAWYSGAKYPLSAALYTSSTLKSRLNARIRLSGLVCTRRVIGGKQP